MCAHIYVFSKRKLIENAPLLPISKAPRGALHKNVNKRPLLI